MLSVLFAATLSLSPLSARVPPFVGRLPAEPRPIVVVPSIGRDLREIGSEINEGRERSELSKRQARELRREGREIRMLERRYWSGGLSGAEQKELRARAEMLRALTRAKRRGDLR